jgi:hypothetical protein
MEEALRKQLAEAVQMATLAPSTHNSQPWKFSLSDDAVRVFPDLSRQLPIADPDDRELYVSLGCALENLVIALDYAGFGPSVTLFPMDEPEACLKVTFQAGSERRQEPLYHAIRKRQTNRAEYEPTPIPASELEKLLSVDTEPGVALRAISAPLDRARIIQLVMDADAVQLSNEKFRHELTQWLRFNSAEKRKKRDGLGVESMGAPTGPRWLRSFFLQHVDPAPSRAERDRRLLETSPAIVALVTTEDERAAWVRAGRTFQRFALSACGLGIELAHMNQPLEIPGFRPEIGKIAGGGSVYPQLLLRLGYARAESCTMRRDVEEVLLETIDTLLPGRAIG